MQPMLLLWRHQQGFQFQQKFKETNIPEEKSRLKREFAAKCDAIHLLPNAPERVYLWKAGNMPVQTVYTDNPGHLYDHEPDFQPYYLEMPLSSEKKPLAGIVLVAGGTHGAGTINECYEIGLEFNALGYACFILQCRPNMGPWSRLESAVDAARCFQLLRGNASKYGLDPDKLVYAGFSNGGVTGDACIEFFSDHQTVKQYFPDYVPDEYDSYYGAENAYLCIYGARHLGTVLSRDAFPYPPTFFAIGREDITWDTPPFFIWQTNSDDPRNAFATGYALTMAGVPFEMHCFPEGVHGLALADGENDLAMNIPHIGHWAQLCAEWLGEQNI